MISSHHRSPYNRIVTLPWHSNFLKKLIKVSKNIIQVSLYFWCPEACQKCHNKECQNVRTQYEWPSHATDPQQGRGREGNSLREKLDKASKPCKSGPGIILTHTHQLHDIIASFSWSHHQADLVPSLSGHVVQCLLDTHPSSCSFRIQVHFQRRFDPVE
jgi:hypothetical protein